MVCDGESANASAEVLSLPLNGGLYQADPAAQQWRGVVVAVVVTKKRWADVHESAVALLLSVRNTRPYFASGIRQD